MFLLLATNPQSTLRQGNGLGSVPRGKVKAENMVCQLNAKRDYSFSSCDFALGKMKLRRERFTCYLQCHRHYVKSSSQQS